jgi:SagB-type dehydrogenase family enzyme
VDPSWLLSLPEEISVVEEAPGEAVLLGGTNRLTARLPQGCVRALLGLAAPGTTAAVLAALVREADGPGALARWYYHLEELARCGLLHVKAQADDKLLATLVPIAAGFRLSGAPLPDHPHILSRFACLRRGSESLVVESPLAHARVLLHDGRAAALISELAWPATLQELSARRGSLPADALTPVLTLLVRAGMVVTVGADGKTPEDSDPALLSWEFHDLYFHSRSRAGRHDSPVGATFPWVGCLEQPPPLKPPAAGVETIELFRPDLEHLQQTDPPFALVVEQRQSLREHAAEPITAQQLGEFLFRVARVREEYEMDVPSPHGPVRMAFTSRPYPAPGSLYEVEVYPVVNHCAGLAPGLYHYDPARHRLERLSGPTTDTVLLLDDAALATGMAPESVQVLLVLTARFPRVAWKYSMLAYALTLKHVGVLYQTMYLAATAMGLAPCAIGAGDSEAVARAAGLDPFAEPAVGEFLLGSRKAPEGGERRGVSPPCAPLTG